MTPLEFHPLHPAQLHHYWPELIEPGLAEIQCEQKADWLPEDIYASIYNARAECFLMKRTDRWLGFFVGYSTPIVYGSTDLKYFLHLIWSVPPADREEEDRDAMSFDRNATIEFVKHRAREHKCKLIETISNRHFHTRLGFEEYARVYRMDV